MNLILDVALPFFEGYDNTSIQDIIDGLGGLTKGAVYHHFKSKEDILSAALDRDNQALFDELRRIRDDGRMTGAEKLQALFAASITGPQMDMWAKAAPDVDPVKNARLLGLQYQAVLQETVPDFVLPIVEQVARRQHQTDRPRVQRGHRAAGEPLGQPHVPFRHRRGAACARRLLPRYREGAGRPVPGSRRAGDHPRGVSQPISRKA
ncbi:MAG: TetR/AcrR family transcriptional regulator [Eggerthella lenta]